MVSAYIYQYARLATSFDGEIVGNNQPYKHGTAESFGPESTGWFSFE